MTDSKPNSAAVGQPDLRALLEELRAFVRTRKDAYSWQVDEWADKLAAVLAVKDTREQTKEDR